MCGLYDFITFFLTWPSYCIIDNYVFYHVYLVLHEGRRHYIFLMAHSWSSELSPGTQGRRGPNVVEKLSCSNIDDGLPQYSSHHHHQPPSIKGRGSSCQSGLPHSPVTQSRTLLFSRGRLWPMIIVKSTVKSAMKSTDQVHFKERSRPRQPTKKEKITTSPPPPPRHTRRKLSKQTK